MGDDWTELYRPKSLKEVVGNPKAVKELREWALSWEQGRPQDKAVVLKGPPGIGKTSTALALARDIGWGVVEMNASDHRNADAIQRVAITGRGRGDVQRHRGVPLQQGRKAQADHPGRGGQHLRPGGPRRHPGHRGADPDDQAAGHPHRQRLLRAEPAQLGHQVGQGAFSSTRSTRTR